MIQLLPLIQTGLQEVLQFIGSMDDASAAQPDEWRHVQHIFQNTTDVDVGDRAVTTFDIVNITNGNVDSSWTQADYDTVDALMVSLVQGWLPHMGVNYRWIETRYYRRLFNPLSIQQPFTPVGAPELIKPRADLGTSASNFSLRQASMTTTDRTPYAKHWGRNYWPFAAGFTNQDGFIPNATVDSMAQLVHDRYLNLMQNQFYPVVPVTVVNGVPTRGLLGITEVQVDNIPDVIRRRRPKKATYKKRLPLVVQAKPASADLA